jgi:hypothetical protein
MRPETSGTPRPDSMRRRETPPEETSRASASRSRDARRARPEDRAAPVVLDPRAARRATTRARARTRRLPARSPRTRDAPGDGGGAREEERGQQEQRAAGGREDAGSSSRRAAARSFSSATAKVGIRLAGSRLRKSKISWPPGSSPVENVAQDTGVWAGTVGVSGEYPPRSRRPRAPELPAASICSTSVESTPSKPRTTMRPAAAPRGRTAGPCVCPLAAPATAAAARSAAAAPLKPCRAPGPSVGCHRESVRVPGSGAQGARRRRDRAAVAEWTCSQRRARVDPRPANGTPGTYRNGATARKAGSTRRSRGTRRSPSRTVARRSRSHDVALRLEGGPLLAAAFGNAAWMEGPEHEARPWKLSTRSMTVEPPRARRTVRLLAMWPHEAVHQKKLVHREDPRSGSASPCFGCPGVPQGHPEQIYRMPKRRKESSGPHEQRGSRIWSASTPGHEGILRAPAAEDARAASTLPRMRREAPPWLRHSNRQMRGGRGGARRKPAHYARQSGRARRPPRARSWRGMKKVRGAEGVRRQPTPRPEVRMLLRHGRPPDAKTE